MGKKSDLKKNIFFLMRLKKKNSKKIFKKKC